MSSSPARCRSLSANDAESIGRRKHPTERKLEPGQRQVAAKLKLEQLLASWVCSSVSDRTDADKQVLLVAGQLALARVLSELRTGLVG